MDANSNGLFGSCFGSTVGSRFGSFSGHWMTRKLIPKVSSRPTSSKDSFIDEVCQVSLRGHSTRAGEFFVLLPGSRAGADAAVGSGVSPRQQLVAELAMGEGARAMAHLAGPTTGGLPAAHCIRGPGGGAGD